MVRGACGFLNMAFKHQLHSYRIKNGIKYCSIGDFFDHDEAKRVIKEIRMAKQKCFGIKYADGFIRIFVQQSLIKERGV
jgi:hypothetical protein